MSKYHASNVLAERAAWNFMEQYKTGLSFDLVVIAPPYVFGPFLHEMERPEWLNVSLAMWYNAVTKGAGGDPALNARGCVMFPKWITRH